MPHGAAAAAAQREIDIVPEPAGHADMPPPPEIGKAGGAKGGLEVFDQVIAQDARRAQHDVAAAGKVHIQLQRKQQRGGRQVGAGHVGIVTVDQRYIDGQVVGNDHLFHVAPGHAERAAGAAGIAEPAGFLNLRAQVGVTLDGAGDQRGEKADEHRIVQDVVLHLAPPLEHVDGVAERRKGKIAQPQRRHQVKGVGLHPLAKQPGQVDQPQVEQVPVLVEQQNARGGKNRQQQKNDPHRAVFALADGKAGGPGHHRCAQQHRHQGTVFGRIAEIGVACDQQKIGPCHPRQHIVQHRNSRKKAEKLQRSDRHVPSHPAAAKGKIFTYDTAD